MTTVDNRPIPNYFVREETTAGPLYFYPMPAVRQTDYFPIVADVTWWHDDGSQAEVREGYVITTSPTGHLLAMWPERPKLSHYLRKAEADLSPVGRTLVAADPNAYPETISKAEWRSRCEYGPDSDCGDCTWHNVRDGLYQRVMNEPSTGQEEFDVSGLEQLDIHVPDPAPDREWRLSSPSLAAFYPRPAHHQFPGELPVSLSEVGAATRAALAEINADVESFYEWEHERKISITVNINWDQALPWEPVKGKSQKARELNYSRRRASQRLTTWHREMKVPQFVSGVSKADALENWTHRLEAMVTSLVPPHTVACPRCKGLGYVR